MRLIEKVSYQSANFITSFLNQNHNKRMILYFGFQAIYGDFFKLLIIIICSLILRSFIPSILISFSFAYLRKNAGGFHMKTENGCILFTTCICVIPGTLISYLQLNSNFTTMILLVFIFILGYMCLLKYAPSSTQNNQITDEDEIIKYKEKSFSSFAFLYFLVCICFFIFNQHIISISISAGILLEVLTLIPLKKTVKLH